MDTNIKKLLNGILSAFDMGNSYYRNSRKKTMKAISKKTNFQNREHPIREARKLMGQAFDEEE